MLIKVWERRVWIGFLAILVAAGVLWAGEVGPLIVLNTSGTPVHTLNTDGVIQNVGARQNGAVNWVLYNAAGTAKAGWEKTNGVLLALDSDARGALTLDGTTEVTKTFTTAEADENYYIIGTLYGGTNNVTDAIGIKTRYVGSFSVNNYAQYGSGYTFQWIKVRHTQ